MAFISVIIPTYNSSRWLSQAIDSVLRQTLPPEEIIVVDDGSTDDTAEVMCQYQGVVSYQRQAHQGVAAALNTGVETATGSHISFLDADDMWLTDKLELQVAILEQYPDLDMVFGAMESFLSPELNEEQRSCLDFSPATVPAQVRGTILVRRDAFEKVGFFDSSLRVGEFIDWYLRAVDIGCNSLMSSDKVLLRRWHSTNMTLKAKQEKTDYIKLFNSWRKRQTQGDS